MMMIIRGEEEEEVESVCCLFVSSSNSVIIIPRGSNTAEVLSIDLQSIICVVSRVLVVVA